MPMPIYGDCAMISNIPFYSHKHQYSLLLGSTPVIITPYSLLLFITTMKLISNLQQYETIHEIPKFQFHFQVCWDKAMLILEGFVCVNSV